MISLH